MSISNARIVSQTASDVTVAVDTDQQYDFVTAAMRTDQAWVEGDKADIEDGDTLPGLQTQTQATQATNTFTFTGVTAPYHLGFSAHNVDETVPPVDPPPVGDVPQATSLTASNITSSAITLNWLSPENTSPAGLLYDYSKDVEILADGSPMPSSVNVHSEGSWDLYNLQYRDRTAAISPKVHANAIHSRFRGDTKSVEFNIFYNSTSNYINRNEIIPLQPSGSGNTRLLPKKTYAFSYSLFIEPNGFGNFYQIIGQTHDVYIPGVQGVSPIWSMGFTNDERFRGWGSVNTKEINESKTDGKNAAFQNYWPASAANDHGRMVDVVWRFCFDAIGSSTFPQDGAPPYVGFCELWVDGVKRVDYGPDLPFGLNDSEQYPAYLKIGNYSGLSGNPPAGGWINPNQKIYISAIRFAEGESATYENMNQAGRVTSIEILQETAPGQSQVIKTLAPSYNSWRLTGLANNTQYKYFVRCRYNNETSTPSATLTVATL